MRRRDAVLAGVHLLLTIKFFTGLAPLLVYALSGYLLVLYASAVLARGPEPASRLQGAVVLGVWTAAWLYFKPASFSLGVSLPLHLEFPALGAFPIPPVFVGASYIYLKVFALIRGGLRGDPPPTLGAFAAQMFFAPAFVAGPIAGREAFEAGYQFSWAAVAEGLNRILGGLFKLFVLCSLLDDNNLLNLPTAAAEASYLEVWEVWAGLYVSSLSIYLNFAGYSDLAIGFGLICGVRLPENFNLPYLAANPSEFWQRWHMSFTSWLRENVFGPVSRSLSTPRLRGSLFAMAATTTATMVFCGLWHHVSLPYLVWGLYHAAAVLTHQVFATRIKPQLAKRGWVLEGRLYHACSVLLTFNVVTVGWTLFLPFNASLEERLFLFGRLFNLC